MSKKKLDLHKKYGCKIVSVKRKAAFLDSIVDKLMGSDSYVPWDAAHKITFATMIDEETYKLYWD